MLLDLYPDAVRASEQPAGAEVATGPAPTMGEGYDVAWQGATRFQNMLARQRAMRDAYDKVADDFYKVSGQRVINGVQPFAGGRLTDKDQSDYRGQGGRLRKAVDEWNRANPDKLFVIPDLEASALEISKQARKAEQDLENRGGSLAAGLGGFFGSAAGAATDLPNVVSMPFGGSGSLAKIFIKEAALGAGATGVSEAAGFEYHQKVDPTYGVGEAAGNVLFGGLTQGALAAGLAGGVRGAAWLFNRGRSAADPIARDAGNVTMGDAVHDARVPRTDPETHSRVLAESENAYEALKGGKPYEPPPDLVDRMGSRTGTVFDAANVAHRVRYELAELDDLITSHLPDFRENPAYPQELQPRDRARAASQAQVNDIASRLEPGRLGPSLDASTGSPIIGPDGIVESGNGRVMAIRRAYEAQMEGAQKYIGWLKSMGFDPDSMTMPVLVGRRISELSDADRVKFTRQAQSSGTMTLSTSERARSDAKLLDDYLFSYWQPGKATSAANREFVRAFAKRLPKGDQAALFDKSGALSAEGARRIEAAMAARAYDDHVFLSRMLEDTDNNIKAIGGALMDSAPEMAKLKAAIARGEVPAHMDLSDDILDAVRLIMRARDEKRPIAEMVSQGDLLFEANPNQISLLKAMFRDDDFSKPVARSKLAELLNDFAREAQKVSDGPMLLGEPLQPREVLGASLARTADNVLPTRAEAVEKLVTPEGRDAAVHEAYRAVEAGGDTIKIDDNGTLRPASEVLMELDEMIAGAKELQMCAMGREAAE